jgi:hypothetical protein
VQCCYRAWEAVEGRKPEEVKRFSGTTDGNILRLWGIPTVRLGLPGQMSPEPGWPPFFDVARPADLKRLTEVYVRMLIDTCTREDLRGAR